MYVAITSRWSYLYFTIYYVFTVTVALNIVIAFFIKSFLMELQHRRTEEEEEPTEPQLQNKEAHKVALGKIKDLMDKIKAKSSSISSSFKVQFAAPTLDDIMEEIE
jgi:hypothetical protein